MDPCQPSPRQWCCGDPRQPPRGYCGRSWCMGPSGPCDVLSGSAGQPPVKPLLLSDRGWASSRAASRCSSTCYDLYTEGYRASDRLRGFNRNTSLPSWDTVGAKNSRETSLHADHFTSRFVPGGMNSHQEQLHHEAADPKYDLCFGQLGGSNCLSMVCEGLLLTEAARAEAAGVAIEEVRGLPPPPAVLMPEGTEKMSQLRAGE